MSEDEHVRPTSPWMPFPILISVLSKVFPSLEIALICKFYKAKKISRHELIQKVRQIVVDKLLISVIKSYRAKFGSLGEVVKSLFLKTRSCADLENEASLIVQVVVNQFCCLVLVVI